MQFKVDVDLYTGMDSDGLNGSVFMGDNCDPMAQMDITWEQAIDEFVDGHCVPGGALVYDGPDYNAVDEVLRLAGKLRAMANYCESKINERGIFMRNEWVDKGSPLINMREEFTVTYSDYLDRTIGQESMF